MYSTFIFEPILNALIFFYSLFNDMGIAIIFLTILIRLILFPLSKKALLAQKKIQEIQPKIQEVQKKYKNDRQRQGLEVMKIYKEANISPFLPLVPFMNIAIQVAVLFALNHALQIGQNINELLPKLYSITWHPSVISYTFFTFLDLTKPNVYFAIIAAAVTYWQIKVSLVNNPVSNTQSVSNQDKQSHTLNVMQNMTRQLNMVLPITTLIVALNLSSALSLYWIVSTLFTVAQEYFLKFKTKNEK